jgi:hypothetical protein
VAQVELTPVSLIRLVIVGMVIASQEGPVHGGAGVQTWMLEMLIALTALASNTVVRPA